MKPGLVLLPPGKEPVVIPNARIEAIESSDVPSEADGVLLVVGVALTKSLVEATSKEERERLIKEGKWIPGSIGYLLAEELKPQNYQPTELLRFSDSPEKVYRLPRKGERLTPGMVRVGMVETMFRKLEVGDRVEKGTILALVDPKLALDDLEIKVAKLSAAGAQRRAAEKSRIEAKKRLDDILTALQSNKDAFSKDEQREAEQTWERCTEEEAVKWTALLQADRELNLALSQLRAHEIKGPISGVVKAIYKNRGDAIRKLDRLLQIRNLDLLRVEGIAEVQETTKLLKGMLISIEPTLPSQPRAILRGHTGEVNCVAVARGPQPRIVSGSDDRSVRVWDSTTGHKLWTAETSSAIRSVACTGPYAGKRNLILAGFADGVAKLYDLDDMKKGGVSLGQVNQGAVTSVAFSPDGKLCLTAGEDCSIQIWKIEMSEGRPSTEILHRLPAAHTAVVTYVQFIPTAHPDKIEFLSVGKDHTLLVWTMEREKAPVKTSEFDQRSGDVAVLGTDGRRVLFEKGTELWLRSLADRTRIEGQLRNPPGSANFSTLALFSPDGKTILTSSSKDQRLQLWRTPPMQGLGSELRQLVWTTGGINCGAFASDSRFVVTGTQDQCVLIWDLPRDEEIDRRLHGQIIDIERILDGGSRQFRIRASLRDPPSWVVPGGPATMMITPMTEEK